MEKEFTDPAPYYYSGSGQFYSPQFVRSLTEAGQTSSHGTCGSSSGNSIATPSGCGPDVAGNAGFGSGAGGGTFLVTLGAIWGSDASTGGLVTVAAIVASVVDAVVQGFLDLFGGSDNPPTPRQLLHGRHPLYPMILGIHNGLIPDEVSAGKPQFSGDPQWNGTLPPAPPSACSQYDTECSANPADTYACGAGACCRDFGDNPTANCVRGCLLGFENRYCGSSDVELYRTIAHQQCYQRCGENPFAFLAFPACRQLIMRQLMP